MSRRFDSTAYSRRMVNTDHNTTDNAHALLGGFVDWALAVQADQRTRHLALLLALHVNAAGEAFPSVERLAELSGMTPRTVQARLQVLIDQGVIADTGRRAGVRSSTRVLRVNGYRPAAWQRPVPARPSQRLPAAPATPAVSLTTSAPKEQANNETSITKTEEPRNKTAPSAEVKAKLAAVKRGERLTPMPAPTAPTFATVPFPVRHSAGPGAAHVLTSLGRSRVAQEHL